MVQDLCNILVSRPGIDQVKSVQSQWLSPYTFSFKAEVDFDGTYLASQLIDKYEPYFMKADMQKDLHVLLAWYAEDVARATEREVLSAEAAVSICCIYFQFYVIATILSCSLTLVVSH
jgi:solute carrier family 30 (zinc transporter), member 9